MHHLAIAAFTYVGLVTLALSLPIAAGRDAQMREENEARWDDWQRRAAELK